MKKDKIIITLRLVLATIFCTFFACEKNIWAADWYVRPLGGNYGTENGSSYENAWDGFVSINWGTSGVDEGDTLYVCGTFLNELLNVMASGSDGAPITIRGDCPGDAGIINQMGSTNKGIRISSQNFITVKNITLTGSSVAGISTDGLNIVLDGVVSYGNKKGAQLNGNNLEVVNSTFHDNETSGCTVSNSDNAYIHNSLFHSNGTSGSGNNHDGLFVGDGSKNFIIENCIAHSNRSVGGTGIDVSGYMDGLTSGTVQYNISYGNEGKGFSASGENGEFTHVYNIAYDNDINYIAYEATSGEHVTAYIYNNTFGNADTASVKFGYDYNSGHVYAEFKNNIISGTYPHAIEKSIASVTLTSEYNCVYGGTDSVALFDRTAKTWMEWNALGFDAFGSINQDPLFIDAADNNFHLQQTSPAIDRGINVGLSTDFDGNPIAQGNGYDIGAYEYMESTKGNDNTIPSPPQNINVSDGSQ